MNPTKERPAGTGRGFEAARLRGARTLYHDTRPPIERVLERLEGVKQVAPDHWIALCPAHDDSRPSLSIKRCSDGNILLHDFGMCDVRDVLAAIGLQLHDLFNHSITDTPQSRRIDRAEFKRHSWQAALGVLGRETAVISIVGHDLADGKDLGPEDRQRLAEAVQRVDAARRFFA